MVSAGLAAVVGLGNLIAYAAGLKVGGKHPSAAGVIIFSVLMMVTAAGFGGGGVDRAHADVIHASGRSGLDLLRGMGRKAHQPVLAHGRASLAHGHVVLPHVNPVGPGGQHQVGAVVEDQERGVGRTDAGVAASHRHQVLVGDRRFDAQLDDVDPPAERPVQELVGPLVTHEVEAGVVEALATVAHASSLPGAPR